MAQSFFQGSHISFLVFLWQKLRNGAQIFFEYQSNNALYVSVKRDGLAQDVFEGSHALSLPARLEQTSWNDILSFLKCASPSKEKKIA